MKTLKDDGFSLMKLIQLSRDDPNLIKSVHIMLCPQETVMMILTLETRMMTPLNMHG